MLVDKNNEKSFDDIKIDSFSFEDNFYFKRENKYWKDSNILLEISRKIFNKTLLLKLKQMQSESNSRRNDENAKLIEAKYLHNLSRNDFRIYKFLRFRGNQDWNLANKILNKGYIKRYEDLFYDSRKITAIGKSRNLFKENKLEIAMPNKLQTKRKIWLPKELNIRKFLEVNSLIGYNINILQLALEVLNYSLSAYIDAYGNLLLIKTELIILIAPIRH